MMILNLNAHLLAGYAHIAVGLVVFVAILARAVVLARRRP